MNVPQNIEAEQAVLGAVLLSKTAFLDARAVLSDDDWYQPRHSTIWRAICDTATTGEPDAIRVAAALTASGELGRVGGLPYLHTLVSGVTTTTNVGYWADLIVESAVYRHVVEVGQRIAQMGEQAAAGERMVGAVDDVVGRAKELTAGLSRANISTGTDVDIYDLLGEELNQTFVIRGLLAEAERLILTAGEGLGKSTLLRQLLVTAAAGLHPFTQHQIEPVKCLAFDYENSRRLSQDRYGPLVRQAAREGRPVERGMLRTEIQPRGVNLLSQGSAMKVLKIVERVKPQLVMIGPIYRLHEGDPNDERDARKISVVLDQIREVSGAAVITEAHMAKSSESGRRLTRPVGSGLWMRWPDYGYGLVLSKDSDLVQRQCVLEPWRGPRDERAWPDLLMSGMAAGKPWPWVQVPTQRRGFWTPEAEAS
jgi:hypothetical protein